MVFLPNDMTDLWQAITGGLLAYLTVILAVRLMGPRSFAKMASHDFAVTVAIGSLLASAATSDTTPLSVPLFAIGVLFILQWIVTKLATRFRWVSSLANNKPLLLMDKQTILQDNLVSAKVTEDELRAKLREANVTDYCQIFAVVFETTGDISVLHGDGAAKLDARLLKDVSSGR